MSLPSQQGQQSSLGLEEQGCSWVLLHTLKLGYWAKHGLVRVQLGAEGSQLSQQGLSSAGVGAVGCDGLDAHCLLQSTGLKVTSWKFWALKNQSYLVVIFLISPWV